MKVRVVWEFEADVSDCDPKFVDIPGLATELARNELSYCLAHGGLDANDFEYMVVIE